MDSIAKERIARRDSKGETKVVEMKPDKGPENGAQTGGESGA